MVHFVRIEEPKDLERVIARMINKILTCDDPLAHAGRFSNLANSWVYCHRLKLDATELKELRERLDRIEKEGKCSD
jgi:hypothetical protein